MSVNTVVTRKGLDYALSAHDNGPFIYIKYFTPVYDYRLDPEVVGTSAVSAFSACADPDATIPFGEIIWNVQNDTDYTLSEYNTFVLSASADSLSQYFVPSVHKSSLSNPINLYKGNPLGNYVSGVNVYYNNGAGYWDLGTSYGSAPGNNNPYTTAVGKYWNVADYYPVTCAGDDTTSAVRGCWSCPINISKRYFKFNKIALYAVRIQNGIELDNPILFAEAFVSNYPVYKKASDGFQEFAFKVQIDLHAISADWQDVFYSTSGDYWSRVPGGAVYYPQEVGVGSFDGSIQSPQAMMHIRRRRISNGSVELADIPQLRLDYDNSSAQIFKILSAGDIEIFSSGVGGDFGCPGITYGEYYYVFPSKNNSIILGKSKTNTFRKMYLSSLCGGIPKDCVIDVNDEQVLIGTSGNPSDYNLKQAILLKDRGIRIADGSNKYGYFMGGDLVRENENLLIYQSYTTATSGDMFIAAGVNKNGSYTTVAGQSGLTHKTLNNYLNTIETSYNNLDPDYRLNLIGRKSIRMFGPVELNSLMDSVAYGYNGSMFTKNRDMYIVAGVSSTDNLKPMAGLITNNNFEIALNYVNKTLYLVANNVRAKRINILHDLKYGFPEDGQFIGRSINVGDANAARSGMDKGLRLGYIGTDGDAGINYGLIKIGQPCQIGQIGDPIDYGFFKNFYIGENLNAYVGEWNTLDYEDYQGTYLNAVAGRYNQNIFKQSNLQNKYFFFYTDGLAQNIKIDNVPSQYYKITPNANGFDSEFKIDYNIIKSIININIKGYMEKGGIFKVNESEANAELIAFVLPDNLKSDSSIYNNSYRYFFGTGSSGIQFDVVPIGNGYYINYNGVPVPLLVSLMRTMSPSQTYDSLIITRAYDSKGNSDTDKGITMISPYLTNKTPLVIHGSCSYKLQSNYY